MFLLSWFKEIEENVRKMFNTWIHIKILFCLILKLIKGKFFKTRLLENTGVLFKISDHILVISNMERHSKCLLIQKLLDISVYSTNEWDKKKIRNNWNE